MLDLTENAAKDTLEQVITEALTKSGSNRSAVRAVCLGVSGVNHPTDQEMILNWLRSGIWSQSDYFAFTKCFLGLTMTLIVKSSTTKVVITYTKTLSVLILLILFLNYVLHLPYSI